MPRYRIISEDNVIVADSNFMEAVHPGDYELVPGPAAPTHKEAFSPKELMDSFSTDEAMAALGSANADVKLQADLLVANRGITITSDDAGYQSAINLLRSDSVLDSDTADSYLLGIPLDRLK